MVNADPIDDIESYLERHQNKQLLRFVTLGSVDDGKSTLIGRLLHDTQGVYEDQLDDARRNAADGAEIDYALITDGLVAEREQGITIDVAYRYFTTANRKFIIADSPGHVQYTRNMATGASTADVAIILIDARHGVLQQSRRHAYIASMLGIPHLFVAINKMDAVDYEQSTYDAIQADFSAFSEHLGFQAIHYLPLSALNGDNVVTPSAHMDWYTGPALLEQLEAVELGTSRNLADFRYPVQTVIRPNQNYRGFAGQIASGVVAVGDSVTILPSGTTSKVSHIDTFDGELQEAFAPMSVTLRLEDEVDASRGDMIGHTESAPHLARTLDAMVVWMDDKPLDRGKSYIIKHTSRYVRAGLHVVRWKLDMDTLDEVTTDTLELNEIGRVRVTAHQPLVFDSYQDNRGAGCFVIVDSLTNNTVGAGMILEPDPVEEDGTVHTCSGLESGVSPQERVERLRQKGSLVWITGGAGHDASQLAYGLERRLFDLGHVVHVLDPEDEEGSVASGAFDALSSAARICAGAGLATICVTESLTSSQSAAVRAEFGEALIEVSLDGSDSADVQVGGQDPESATSQAIVAMLRSRGFLLSD